MLDSVLIIKALEFAKEAHGDQKRRYTNEPYILHPIAVAQMMESYFFNVQIICAALLHDTVEDTEVTNEDIQKEFGHVIAKLVEELTDVYTAEAYPNINRKERKKLECHRLSKVSRSAKLIKIADLIDNSVSILEHDPDFGKVYMEEYKELLYAIAEDHHLWNRAQDILIKYQNEVVGV